MRVLVQRCDKASVSVDNKIVGSINKGMMILYIKGWVYR